MNPIQEIVKAYRIAQGNGKPLPLREFAEQLSAPLQAIKRSFTYGSIQHWEAGRHAPDDDKIHLLILIAPEHTWQCQFASDVRAAKYPTVYQPVGEIGKRILGVVEGEHDPERD